MLSRKRRKVKKALRPRPLQNEVLRYIESYKADPTNDGNSPTYREIAKGLGKSATTIYTACRSLEANGLIEFNARGKITLQGGKYMRTEDEPT